MVQNHFYITEDQLCTTAVDQLKTTAQKGVLNGCAFRASLKTDTKYLNEYL
jgi:hypothetical protein